MKKTIITLTIAILVVVPVFALALNANAQSAADPMLWGGFEDNVQSSTGLGNVDPRQMAAQVVNIMLGFLGIIAVVIILLGGFKWMTAAGDEAKIDEAKKLIGAGVIGLVIILAAFGVAQFVIAALHGATGATL